MAGRDVLPDEMELWNKLVPPFKRDLKAKAAELWQLSGMEQEHGLYSAFASTFEAREMVAEIAVFLLCAILLDVEYQRNAKRFGRPVGRPRDVMSRELGSNLLSHFRRNHNSGGRHSVAISIDGKQAEAGRLFEFIKEAIAPLNRYLKENNRRPLSAARLARYALEERRRNANADGLPDKDFGRHNSFSP